MIDKLNFDKRKNKPLSNKRVNWYKCIKQVEPLTTAINQHLKSQRDRIALTRVRSFRSAEFRFSRYRIQRPLRYVFGPLVRKLLTILRFLLTCLYLNPFVAYLLSRITLGWFLMRITALLCKLACYFFYYLYSYVFCNEFIFGV